VYRDLVVESKLPYRLSEVEKKIVIELVKNPRASDNFISKITKVPLKTVNRKRKELETKGFLNYYAYLDNFFGTKLFTSRQMFLIKFKHGITRDYFIKKFSERFDKLLNNPIIFKHVFETHLGEQNGCLVLVCVLESFSKNDLIEIFNAEIVRLITEALGPDSISQTEVIDLTMDLSLLHNYSCHNMKNGYLKKIPDKIFVSE
jgi:DNA-binding Lrp family transcriptional regulator